MSKNSSSSFGLLNDLDCQSTIQSCRDRAIASSTSYMESLKSPHAQEYTPIVSVCERIFANNDSLFRTGRVAQEYCMVEVGLSIWGLVLTLSHVMRKLDFCICENKAADQLCSNCTADQRLCFRYLDSKS